jgi:metal-sulfur cluster biosynthetic enzyme
MGNREIIIQSIVQKLSTVIDPETGIDVIRMRLIEELTVDDNGLVKYKFRPSSPLCPIAIPLSVVIQKAVAEVEGVTSQQMKIVGFAMGDELMKWLNQAMPEASSSRRNDG